MGVTTMKGSILRKFADKGFGFISSKNKEYFFHCSQTVTSFDSLNIGDNVEFSVEDSPKGPRAVKVERV